MSGRKPKVIENADGSVEARLVIPPGFAIAAHCLSKAYGIPLDVGLAMLLGQISARLEDGDASFFSLDVQHALRRVANDRGGTLTPGPAIDLEKLHRSDRTKSGYVGVYANGKGFRAMAKAPDKGLHHIGTYKTSEEAAWQRYRYYQQHGLPYGELEVEMDRWRNPQDPSAMPFTGTDEELVVAIRRHTEFSGTTRQVFGPNNENVPPKLRGQRMAASAPDPAIEDAIKMKIAGFDPDNLPPEAKALLDADGE